MSRATGAEAESPLVLPAPPARPGRTRRNLSREMWHERIVETALILGDEYGDEALTAELVAQSAGLSRAHLYKFFPRRDDIQRAVVDARAARLAERLLDQVARATSVEQQVREIVEVAYGIAGASGELLHSFRQQLAPAIGRALLGSDDPAGVDRDAGLIGHAVLAMAEGAALTSAAQPARTRRASIDAVVTLIREVLLSVETVRLPGAADSRGRTGRRARGSAPPRR